MPSTHVESCWESTVRGRHRRHGPFDSLLILAAAVVALLLPRAANAQAVPYARPGIQATNAPRLNLTLSAGTYTFATNSVSPGGDPVIHLLRNSPFADIKHDDDSAGDPNATMTVTIGSTQAGAYTLV